MATREKTIPSILAPAGTRAAFMAALAAGADAVYCGLKQFSARMEAKNFSLEELGKLTQLAHAKGVAVYVAINTMLKPGEIDQAGRIIDQLNRWVKPDALIVQDLAFVELARQTGFSGQLHLSTLANMSICKALDLVKNELGVNRIVLPREFSIEEIKALAQACPTGLDLEVFIHGALCFGVSGRCYWSSFLGGKSGLRGRCVQPCRRMYTQKETPKRYFSCQDLSLDVLVKVLREIPQVRTWKIEGRKKGPHYVYYTVQAYRILRDQGRDPKMKKLALELLERSLGRVGTHYNFLPQRPQNPVNLDKQTGSGLMMGTVKGSPAKPYLVPREDLLQGDVLRLGYEDEGWHRVYRVKRYVPKRGRLYLKLAEKSAPPRGIPVFLTDRREKALSDLIVGLERELSVLEGRGVSPSAFSASRYRFRGGKKKIIDYTVYRRIPRSGFGRHIGLWLSDEALKNSRKLSASGVWWWLPPITWPANENQLQMMVDRAVRTGFRNFVLNAPWQTVFFRHARGANLWAGPFCNLSNGPAMKVAATLGFKGAMVSPELSADDYYQLVKTSPLPLGIVLAANWPLCISRSVSESVTPGIPFISPRGEAAWVKRIGPDVWVYPNWELDIREKRHDLLKAGYSHMVCIQEPVPGKVAMKRRPGLWNWNHGLG